MKKVLYLMMVLAVCGTAHATVLLYDGFDYPAGENLHDQEGWDILLFGNAITPVITAAETRSGHGNSITSTGVDATYCIRQHLIPQAIDTSVDIVYLSALMRQDADTYHDAQGMLLGIGNGENGAAKKVEARFNPHSEKIVIYDRGYFEPTGMVFEKNRTYQLVFKLSPVVDEPNLIMMDAGYFDVTDGPVADESEIVYQVSQHVSGTSDAALLLPFGHVYIGFRGDVIVGDDFVVTDDWADIQAVVAAPKAHLTLDADTIVMVDPNDPNSEVLAVDVTGNGYDGILDGQTEVDGLLGGALAFDGTGFVTLVDSNTLPMNDADSTVMLWLNTTSEASMAIVSHMPADGVHRALDRAVAMNANNSGAGLLAVDHGWVGACFGVTAVNDGEWHHAAYTQAYSMDDAGADVEAITLYVDGVEDGATTWTSTRTDPYEDNLVNIGGGTNSSWFPNAYEGMVDDIRIYDKTLTADEIAAVVTATPDPAHYWPLDEDTTVDVNIIDAFGGMDGVNMGAVSAAGVYGNALMFDGTNYVEIADFNTADLKNITVAMWMNPDVGLSSTGTIKRVFSGADNWEVVMQGSTGQVANNFYQSGGTYPKSNVIPVEGEWTHVAMTSELKAQGSGLMTIYINGVLDAWMPDLGANDWNGGTVMMGSRPGRPETEHYKGLLDDIQIFNCVLNKFQIAKVMGAGLPEPEPPVDPDPNEVTLMIAPIGSLSLDDPNDDDPNTPILVTTINGTSTDLLVLGTTTANPDNQERADNFDVSQDSDYARRDSENFLTTMFDVPVSVIYILEKDGQDGGYIEVLNAEGGTISDRVDFTGDNFSKTPSSQWIIGGMMVIADVPVNGIRIWSTGIDVQSVSAIPAP